LNDRYAPTVLKTSDFRVDHIVEAKGATDGAAPNAGAISPTIFDSPAVAASGCELRTKAKPSYVDGPDWQETF
jgi:hypothetical protein